MAHPTRETFFIGPDNYIYQNSASMKKFVDALKKNYVTEKSISIPITPMSTLMILIAVQSGINVQGDRFSKNK